jgi:energy-coupling factor transporter ATP-binding protein EcfA2
MKNFLFICGPNGIGKTTICKTLLKRLSKSAYVDSDPCRMMNPFVLNDETIPTIRKNLSDMIKNYFDCPAVQTIIFSYGFHGRRKEVFDGLIKDLANYEYNFIPLLLICNEAENIRRMNCDGRDIQRIKRSLEFSRGVYNGINYQSIDISTLSVDEAVSKILDISKL